MRGTGAGVSQSVIFDAGDYTISLDAVKRTGYAKTAAPLTVSIDGVTLFGIAAAQLSERWARYASPSVRVEAGSHRIAITIGEGGMDMIDNVAITRVE